MFRKIIFICLMLLACLFVMYASAETTTVMVYMCGSNLETLYSAATKDVQEMQNSGLDSSQTRVYFMAGGSKLWNHSTIGGNQGGVYTLEKKKHGDGINLNMLEKELSGMNMGKQDTLLWFLTYCMEHSQTDRYALILWDHGGGPVNGVCWDEQYGGDHLTLEELTGALAASPFAEKKLSWIGFDACLMSSVEVASKMAPYAEYMVASQAEEPGSGWNYAFLKGLENDENGEETGKRIIDAYFAVPYKTAVDLTMSCVDLNKVGEIETRMDAVFSKLAEMLTEDTFSEFARLRNDATAYGKSAYETKGYNGYDLVDVISLSQSYDSEYPDGIAQIMESVENAVVYSRSNVKGSGGLSVYHPFRNQERYTEWEKAYEQLSFCPGYTSYVKSYGQIMTGEHFVVWNQLSDIKSLDSGAVVVLNITEEQAANLASARLVVLGRNLYDTVDKAYYRVYSTADVTINGTQLTAAYDGTTMQVMNVSGYSPLALSISYRVSEDGTYLVNFYPVNEDLTRIDEPIIAEYIMDETGQLILKGYAVYDDMTGTYSHRAEVDLSKYVGITFQNDYRVPTVNARGEYVAFEQWDLDTHENMQWKSRRDIDRTDFIMTMMADSIAGEALAAAYEITDTQGNVYMTELVSLNRGGVVSYECEYEIGNELPYMQETAQISWQSQKIVIGTLIQNVSEQNQMYSLKDMEINGQIILDAEGSFASQNGRAYLEPGEYGAIFVTLDQALLEGMRLGTTIQQITGTMKVWMVDANLDYLNGYSFRFCAEADLPLSAIFPGAENSPTDKEEDESIQYLSTTYPTLDEAPLDYSVFVIRQPLDYAADSRMIVNFSLENNGSNCIHYLIGNVKLNGTAVDAEAINFQGSGEKDFTGRSTVAPGEQRGASVVLQYADIARIFPDVALLDISFDVYIYQLEGENDHLQYILPFHTGSEIPLQDFYDDAVQLPEWGLVEYGKTYGAYGPDTARELFSCQGCSVSLEGVYVVGRSFVLLLRCENLSDVERKISFGRAELDGQAAVIGKTGDWLLNARNNRVKTYGLDQPKWPIETSSGMELYPGESQYTYISVVPASEEQTKARKISFQAYLYDPNNVKDAVYIDRIELETEEYAPLEEEILGIAPAADYTVTVGEIVPKPESSFLLEDTVALIGAEERQPVLLKMTAADGETITNCFYMLFRHVRSDAELANMNILNEVDPASGKAVVSFANGQEWLIYEAYGFMQVAEDGTSASAVYPGLRPMVRAGKEGFPLSLTENEVDAQGNITFTEYSGGLWFDATAFHASLTHGVGAITLQCNPDEGTAALVFSNESKDTYSSLAGSVHHNLQLFPADIDGEALVNYLNTSTSPVTMRQFQYMYGKPLQYTIEPLPDPENYVVTFFYVNTEHQVKCSPLQSLTDFVVALESE